MANAPFTPGWHVRQNEYTTWLLTAGEGVLEARAGKQAHTHSAGVAAYPPALSGPFGAQGSVRSVSTAACFKASCWGQPPWLLQAS